MVVFSKNALLRLKTWAQDKFEPEQTLRGTQWEAEWYEFDRRRMIASTRYLGIIASLVWILHYPFYDVLSNSSNLSAWLTVRLVVFFWVIAWTGLTFIPKFYRSGFYRLPAIAIGWGFCYAETFLAHMSDRVLYLYPLILLTLAVVVVRWNLVRSITYGLVMLASIATSMLNVYSDKLLDVFSGTAVIFCSIYILRSRHRDEVYAFLNVRKLSEAREQVLTRELELAGAVQNLLLPKIEEVSSDHFKMAAKFVPVGQSGGDWWWFDSKPETLQIILADVAGHGAGPAMVAAIIASLVKTAKHNSKDFPGLLRAVQKYYDELFAESNYWTTITAAEIDFKAMKLTAWFAGGPPILCASKAGGVENLSQIGSPFGTARQEMGTISCDLNAGDRIVFASDGVFDECNTKLGAGLSPRVALQLFAAAGANNNTKDAADNILSDIQIRRGDNPQRDDYTLVVVDIAVENLKTRKVG